jgi:predicted DNA-binding ribbon-helix-helix protein
MVASFVVISAREKLSMTNQNNKGAFYSASGRDPPLSNDRIAAADMKSAIVKRSIELNGHKTSVSLEDEFWTSLRSIANLQHVSLPALLQTIDAGRENANLSSAIRVHVLNYYRTRAAAQAPGPRLPPPLPRNA